MLVKRWMGGVITTITKTMINDGDETKREKRRAPAMKSSWSAMGKEAPGERFSLLLKKDSAKSPIKAPRESTNPSKGLLGFKRRPTRVPMAKPAKKPRKVFRGPSMGRPSRKFLPRSMGVPPPKIIGAALAQ